MQNWLRWPPIDGNVGLRGDAMRVWLTGCGAAVLCAAVVATGADSARPQSDQGKADQGRVAFDEAGCATCHGPTAKGGTGPALVPMTRSYSDFATLVREGTGEMPPYSPEQLTDDELTAIYRYLKG